MSSELQADWVVNVFVGARARTRHERGVWRWAGVAVDDKHPDRDAIVARWRGMTPGAVATVIGRLGALGSP